MKGEEGKIKKHRKRKGRVNWLKRSLAVCLAAATLMTGVGLESVFADEAVSNGKIETQQSAQTEVQTQARQMRIQPQLMQLTLQIITMTRKV